MASLSSLSIQLIRNLVMNLFVMMADLCLEHAASRGLASVALQIHILKMGLQVLIHHFICFSLNSCFIL